MVDKQSSSSPPEEELEFATPGENSLEKNTTSKSVMSNVNSNTTPDEASRTVHDKSVTTTSETTTGEAIITTQGIAPSLSPVSRARNGVDTIAYTLAPSTTPFATSSATSLSHNRASTPRTIPTSVSPAPVLAIPPPGTPKSIKVEEEVARLKEAIEDASPEALHKLLRQEWRAFLYTPLDEDHLTYILRACLKNSTPIVVERGVKEILSKPEHRPIIVNGAIKYVTTDELTRRLPTRTLIETVNKTLANTTATAVIKNVPHNVLNEVAAHQVGILSAKDLVDMLAREGRLGYSLDDIIDEESELVSPPEPEDRGTSYVDDAVMSGVQYSKPPQPKYHPVVRNAAIGDTLLEEQEMNRVLELQRDRQASLPRQQQQAIRQDYSQPPSAFAPARTHAPPANAVLGPCKVCGFTSPTRGGQAYHAYKMPCENTLKKPGARGWAAHCPNCGQNFTQSGGYQYHKHNNVCSTGKYADPVAPFAPPRPTFVTSRPPFSQAVPTQAPILPTQSADKQIPRPPLHTPTQTTPISQAPRSSDAQSFIQATDPDARVNPSQLSPEKKANMDAEISAEDIRYHDVCLAIDHDADLTAEEKLQKKTSRKNMNATKKSQIRKKYGASLRLRERDKIALKATALSSPAAASSSKPYPSYSSPAVQLPSYISTPSSGFSPINAPSRHVAGPSRPPPILPPQYTQQQNGNASASSSTNLRSDARLSGFGILRTNKPSRPQGYQNQNPSYPNKRQRTSSIGDASGSGTQSPAIPHLIPPMARTRTPYDPPSSTSGPGLSMIEVSSEDAASKYPKKKVPVAAAQAKWEQLRPRKNDDQMQAAQSTPADATAPGRQGSNTVREAIEIDSGSDTEDLAEQNRQGARILHQLMADQDRPLPSTEDTESEGAASRPTSSGRGRPQKFMARRGGRSS